MRWTPLVLLAGCAPAVTYHVEHASLDGRIERRHFVTLVSDFESSEECGPDDEVVLDVLTAGLVHASGCADEADYAYTCGAHGLSNYTCWWTRLGDLDELAGTQLGCSPDALDVRIVDARSREVAGCGRRATFVLACDEETTIDDSCGWIPG